jgi:hypothetical protein
VAWPPNDAERHKCKATTRALKDLWAKIANESLERADGESCAIREAIAGVARSRHCDSNRQPNGLYEGHCDRDEVASIIGILRPISSNNPRARSPVSPRAIPASYLTSLR